MSSNNGSLTRVRGNLEATFATLLRGLGRAESGARIFDGTIDGSKKKAGMRMDATTVIGELEAALAALPGAIEAAYGVAAGTNSSDSAIDAKINATRAARKVADDKLKKSGQRT